VEFKRIDELNKFLVAVDQHLLNEDHGNYIIYPPGSVSSWDSGEMIKANDALLSRISGNANVYMLFTAGKGQSAYRLRYIGKTKRNLARERIKNHLFKKHEDTGAKLAKVMSHVRAGGKIKISWVSIEPQSLRNWAEEELISKHPEADWNRENA